MKLLMTKLENTLIKRKNSVNGVAYNSIRLCVMMKENATEVKL